MSVYIVRKGDCLSKIAHDHGIADWRVIYDHPNNAPLRKARPNPHILFEGDQVFVPEKQKKQVSVATGARHTFRVKLPKREIRLRLLDAHGQPLANVKYQLKGLGEGTTDGDGRLKASVPVGKEEVELVAGELKWVLRVGHLDPLEDVADEGLSGVQSRLANLGYYSGPVDGKVGPKTKAAIRAFQRAHPPLRVDGICGPKTRAKLQEEHGC
jgi:hypothetical protein